MKKPELEHMNYNYGRELFSAMFSFICTTIWIGIVFEFDLLYFSILFFILFWCWYYLLRSLEGKVCTLK